MSGRVIKPIAISNVYSVYEAVDVPLIGVGGIYTWQDAVEFIFAGARAVQIGTAIMDEGVTVFDDINKVWKSSWMKRDIHLLMKWSD